MHTKTLGLTVLFLLMSQGCATLDKSECAAADWAGIGERDGANGLPPGQLAKHHKACAKHGIAIDPEPYHRGRERGLSRYCTPDSGYQLGVDGGQYQGVCPAAQAERFTEAYTKGLKIKLDTLSLEQTRLDQELLTSRLERAALATQGPNEKLDEHIESLQSRSQSLLSERLELQRWIARWSGP